MRTTGQIEARPPSYRLMLSVFAVPGWSRARTLRAMAIVAVASYIVVSRRGLRHVEPLRLCGLLGGLAYPVPVERLGNHRARAGDRAYRDGSARPNARDSTAAVRGSRTPECGPAGGLHRDLHGHDRAAERFGGA